jgi:glutamine synthetase
MDVMQKVKAERHDLKVLLHEKPFKGYGSGKT